MRTFCFMADQPIMFFFKPGQFVTLELEIDGKQVMRSYTISSSPSVPYSFSITVKRVPGGQVSNWLHDNMHEGFELAVHGPVGLFNAIDFPAPKVLYLSGGVGITPVMSMARWFYDTNGNVDMVFVHSARSPKDIIYHRELDQMASRIPNFSLHIICEKHGLGEPWSGYRGYLNQRLMELIAPDYMERVVFCCGPTPYMNAVKRMLEAVGFDMRNYHEESFGATPAEAKADAVEHAEQAAEAAEELDAADLNLGGVRRQRQEHPYRPGRDGACGCGEGGADDPKACGMGICGTCKVLKLGGEVVMDHNGGITEEDEAEATVVPVSRKGCAIDYDPPGEPAPAGRCRTCIHQA